VVLNGARTNPGTGRWSVSLARWALLVACISQPEFSILKLSSRSVKTDRDDGAGGTKTLVAWPAFWDFSRSHRLTVAALVITDHSLYQRDLVAAAPGRRR
jgi:hypothetical protein